MAVMLDLKIVCAMLLLVGAMELANGCAALAANELASVKVQLAEY